MDKLLLLPQMDLPRQPSGPAAWGTPTPLLHKPISDISEAEFVSLVLAGRHQRERLFNIHGLDATDAIVRERIELRQYKPELVGDIDILVLPAGHPERATAIQVKRVKVGAKAVKTGKPNRLADFREGVEQANRTADLGFFQVYLFAIVLVDTRERNAGRLTYAGIDPNLQSRIRNVVSRNRLDARVGLLKAEWVQPMDRPPLTTGSSGLELVGGLATASAQPADLTAWLATLY
jgi:hypothetical protein